MPPEFVCVIAANRLGLFPTAAACAEEFAFCGGSTQMRCTERSISSVQGDKKEQPSVLVCSSFTHCLKNKRENRAHADNAKRKSEKRINLRSD